MGTGLRDRSSRRERPSTRSSWALQPVSRIVGQRPLEFVRRRTWTSNPTRLANGISAVTSLCLCDENTGGPSLLISGDEDGGVCVLKLEGGGDESSSSKRLSTQELRRVRLHSSCVNTIKVLPDQRGYVCAGDDGALTAVASLEASSEAEIGRAALHLTGHSGFVTDCDAARTGHGILSSSTDGRMLLWDPVSSNTPVASVSVGRPVNSACFSAGDPYALVCAPELGEARSSRGGGSGSVVGGSSGGNDDLVQIWDLRFLRCFKDSIPAAIAAAFGEESLAPTPQAASMQPPLPQSPQVWPSSMWSGSGGSATTSRSSAARTPGEVPSWLTTVLGSTSAASPVTPLLRRSAWTDDSSSDAESSEMTWHRERGSLWSCGTPGSTGKENAFPSSRSTCSCSPASVRVPSEGSGYTTTPCSSARKQGPSKPAARRVAAPARDGPAATLCLASLPDCGCLHQGKGKTWVPGGLKTWQVSSRRARTAEARQRAVVTCAACSSTPEAASAFSVQVSEDGRLIMVASRDRTVTLFDAQSREVVYRFGHPKLSTRARPILVAGDRGGGGGGWGRGTGGSGRGDVFCGTTEGEVRCWRVGSQFPNRVFKPVGHHEGFEVCCLATSRNGAMFASADLSGTVCVQSASSGRQTHFGMDGE